MAVAMRRGAAAGNRAIDSGASAVHTAPARPGLEAMRVFVASRNTGDAQRDREGGVDGLVGAQGVASAVAPGAGAEHKAVPI